MFDFTIKNVPTTFVSLGNEEVEADEVFELINFMFNENDVNNYDLNQSVADALVKEGVLEKIRGSRMATLYRKTDKFNSFYDSFIEEFCSHIEKIKENQK